MAYTQAAVERAMKVHEVLMQALTGRQPWIQVAEVLGVSARTVRRLRWRYERDGFTGLYDHRHHTPSPRAVPLAEVQRILQLYRDRYGPRDGHPGFNVRHFYERARREHGVTVSYSFVKKALQAAPWSARAGRAGGIGAAASPGRVSANCCISTAAAIAGWPWCRTPITPRSSSSMTPPSTCSTPS